MPTLFDRALLRTRRDRFADVADRYDFLLQRVADDVAERLSVVRRTFASPVCVGAGHGVVSRRLQAAGLPAILNIDASARLLAQANAPRVVGDEDALPLADASADLIVSPLSLHLVNDVPGALIQMRRALKPDGLLIAAVLGGETLRELREAWLVAEEEVTGGASLRVAPFADVRAYGSLLQRAQFALPVTDSDVVTVRYASPLVLMQELRAMGMSNMLTARRRVPVTRRLMARAADVYVERYAQVDGRIPATFEIITMTAWAPHESQQKPLQPGSAKARLADALGVVEETLKREP